MGVSIIILQTIYYLFHDRTSLDNERHALKCEIHFPFRSSKFFFKTYLQDGIWESFVNKCTCRGKYVRVYLSF